jgi:hypothetical protein
MDATTRLNNLLRSLPGPGAGPGDLAQWFLAKADTLDAIAEESSDFAGACWDLARAARRQAATKPCRRSGCGPPGVGR